MRRTTSAVGGRSGSATELIERITAERGSDAVTDTGRHRLPSRHAEAVVTTEAPRTSSMTRRLAPLAVGAVVMLVATLVATLAQPPEDPSLAAQELSNTVARTDPAQAPPATPEPTPEPTAEPQAAAEPTEPPATPKPEAAERKTAGNGQAAAPRKSGEGKSAAAAKGWTRAGGDEFNSGLSPLWSPYDSEGHDGAGRRTPDAVSVENGSLVIRGDSEGNTGGMSWKEDQRFGRWEMRARFPKGDDQYHPVLILWRESGGKENGEIDFAETTSASPDVSFFLHYGSDQKYAKKTLDITQWHNYAVEWVDGRVTGYIDGEKWFESTDSETLPPGKMHATIQLDYFPEGGSPKPTEMYVDYMRIYR
ncbi:family 16 glycosylhydrolase [Pseudonocardia sp. DSM 110487]|uniref:glycoside hydrolase family 16 protein n=1 Tax=Pseudonocardia sp. DSM 110487 TaxID=2865833 RepID=UPI001C6A6112|nr:glycoside hydrolase family 16 protein [Pseudonocardia sp. DSM 110487]QYN35959.1 family 16 glycosylhydrolase [Pseudonocardia sp. DSM 110487]